MLLLSIIIPVLWGLAILLLPAFKSRNALLYATGAGLAVAAGLGLVSAFSVGSEVFLFSFGKNLDLYFRVDQTGALFAAVVILAWSLSGVYAFEYMKHEREEKRYFGFYVMVFGILHGLVFAGNIAGC